MRIAFLTLGCKLNYAETSTYERGFAAAGLEIVPWREKADIYLVNTCSVTSTADMKSRNLVRRCHRLNPDAKLIVTGCSAQLRREELEAIEGVAKVFGADEKSLVVPGTLALVIPGFVPGKTDPAAVFGAYSSGERTRSFLKVQDGCDNFCKYCTVPYARGRSRNVPVCECVRGAREIASKGIREIVLTGVNTGDFGRTTGESFLDLLKALDAVEGIERYRISSIEPNLLTEDIVDWIASGTKFQPHFHIPLQTGSDVMLEKMGRRYTTAFFADRIDYIRKKLEAPGKPLVFFGIDVMVGLPGETEELFRETVDFITRIHPAFIHVFPYSRRPGTPAAEMPGQVSAAEKARRVAVLEELCARFHEGFREANKGVRERVLWESSDRNGRMEGYTGNYIRLERPYDGELAGKICDVVI
ncbi:MAG: tRNA (N(6)-L-threonylcarbamoyladenosine(37)-C(2))-methylthiotransferase MtaB [Bacteroidales bacterium]|nr:tRNA (N(6)-L-threonylcarbamoyladenosine(37)-C(2))-methylthiotransferase MtaB [Bacteroidales bacterium]